MNGSLVIPRKDWRLAGVVMAPALAVTAVLLVFALCADLIPGVSQLLWPGRDAPSFSGRLERVLLLLAVESYIVPCWAAVVIALGDRARRAQYLASSMPAPDGSKALSKVVVAAVCAVVMWALFATATIATGSAGLGAAQFLLLMLGISLGGAMCGIGAANLVRRIASAGLLAMCIPLIGIPLAQLAGRALIQLPGSEFLTSEEEGILWVAREAVQVKGAACAAVAVAVTLAAFAAPMLAGRDTRPRVVRALLCATLAGMLVAAATAAALSSRWTMFGSKLAALQREILERSQMAGVTDRDLVIQVANDVSRDSPHFFREPVALALAAGNLAGLVDEERRFWSASGDADHDSRPWPTPALYEFGRRRVKDEVKLVALINSLVAADALPIRVRVAVSRLSIDADRGANLALLLVAATNDIDRAQIIVELADRAEKSYREPQVEHTSWCKVLECARIALELPVSELNTHSGIWSTVRGIHPGTPSYDSAPILRQAVQVLSRPMPELAERVAELSPPPSPESLECLRKGLPAQEPAPDPRR